MLGETDGRITSVPAAYDYDVLVIGSGFGGSVAALRLTEKGYRVGVIEAGRRFEDADYPGTSWNARRFFWAPKLGCMGIQRIHLLRNVIILAGAGVGGGSLVYANTLYEPKDAFTTTASGRTSPTGAPSSRPITARRNGCWAWCATRR
jgi:cholesterol oxidase